jgi:hypothetical protein
MSMDAVSHQLLARLYRASLHDRPTQLEKLYRQMKLFQVVQGLRQKVRHQNGGRSGKFDYITIFNCLEANSFRPLTEILEQDRDFTKIFH